MRTIASQLGVHHYTVDRVLSEAAVERGRQCRRGASKLDPYMGFLIETLERFLKRCDDRVFQEYGGGFRAPVALQLPMFSRTGPAMPRISEPSFNVELGNVLRMKHPRWVDRIGVEQTGVLSEAANLRPDIVIRHPGGLPVVVETEFAPARTVEADACARLGKTLQRDGRGIEQSIALCIPVALSTASQHELGRLVAEASLEFCVFSGNPENSTRWPQTGWIEGGIDDLAACIEQAALSEDRIAQGMQILEQGIAQAAEMLRDACVDAPAPLTRIADGLHQRDGVQTTRMAMAIVANALTFHISIVGTRNTSGSFVVEALDALRGVNGRLMKGRVLEHWRHIRQEINYWPIFEIASEMLLPIANGTAHEILDRLAGVAAELDALGATSQHDLSGRMFQRLIADRKFLATFYTLPSSAALLAELAVARLDTDWSDREAVSALRIADFACGTGALLNATYEAVLTRYRRKGQDDRSIHSRMMESAVVGTDIMPAATHLTASVLSSTHPRVPFESTSIITLPYGEQPERSGRPIALGALDLIEEETTLPLFGTGQQRVRGVANADNGRMELPHAGFDLVIMNPPFTRPTNHEATDVPVPSFAGFATGEAEQRAMSRQLRKVRRPGMAGHGNAGLASNFLDIANAKLRTPGGVLALVLPASFLQGESWAAARRLLDEHYTDVVIVSIAAVGTTDSAFSADTGMAEVLVVATRNGRPESTDASALFVNLLRRPETILEAVTSAWEIRRIPVDRRVGSISIGSGPSVGCYLQTQLSETGSAGVREPGVVQAAAGLTRARLELPRWHHPMELPVADLGALGDRGLLHRDINGKEIGREGEPRGPFDIAQLREGEIPTYPALWSHDAERETRMIVEPDSAGIVRPGCDERADDVWRKTVSSLHFSLDFRINSQPLAACMTPEPSIGGRAWPNFLCSDERWQIPLVLWANTTLGLIAFWWIGTRQQQGRAVLTISKLPALTVLDARRLSDEQLDRAGQIFGEFEGRRLLPANEAWRDDMRQALDRAVLIDLLQLPQDTLDPLALLRRQWCAEPSVHGGKNTAP